MNTFDQEHFNTILQQVDIKPRLKKELRFVASTAHMPEEWSDYELLAIHDRTGDKGALFMQPEAGLYAAQYELSRRIVDSSTGRDRVIICDFCYTWQPGANAASITFTHASSKHRVRFLCCADLNCSQHVRTATKASIVSRSQLRENITNEDRIARLKQKLQKTIKQLDLQEIVL